MCQSAPLSDAQLHLPCPICGQATDSLKCYRIVRMTYLVMAVSWKKPEITACPKCMRAVLLENAGTNLFTAHIAWPFSILPMTIAYWIDLSTPGHSTNVLEWARNGYYGNAATSIAAEILSQPRVKRPILARFIGFGKILFGLVALLVASVFLISKWYKLGDAFWPTFVICTLTVAISITLIRTGLANLRLQTLSWKVVGLWLLAAGMIFSVASPLTTWSFWQIRERTEASTPDRYDDRVPAPHWQAETLRHTVDRMLEDYRSNSIEGKYPLQRVLTEIERNHSGDSAFQTIANDIRAALGPTTQSNVTAAYTSNDSRESAKSSAASSQTSGSGPAGTVETPLISTPQRPLTTREEDLLRELKSAEFGPSADE